MMYTIQTVSLDAVQYTNCVDARYTPPPAMDHEGGSRLAQLQQINTCIRKCTDMLMYVAREFMHQILPQALG